MKTKAAGIFLCFICFGISVPAFADTAYSFGSIFNLQYPENDLSIKMLQMLFGKVGSSLNLSSNGETENLVIQNLFNIFNTGVLTMVMMLVLYSVLLQSVTISQDANQGMSKQSSVFLTLRIVIGSGLLLPSFSGYSAIQVMVMNVVVYGIAFANYAWVMTYQIAMGEIVSPTEQQGISIPEMYPNGLTNTWGTGTTYTTASQTQTNCKTDSSIKVTAIDLYAMALCTQLSAQAASKNGYSAQYAVHMQSKDQTSPCSSDSSKYYTCFGTTSSTYATSCGSISFDDADQQAAANTAVNTAMNLAQQAVQNSASYLASSKNTNGGEFNDLGKQYFQCTINASDSSIKWPDGYIAYENNCEVQNDIAQIANAYANALFAKYNSTSSDSSDAASDDESVKTGWATAGQYFQSISLSIASGAVQGANTDYIDTSSGSSSNDSDIKTMLDKRGSIEVIDTTKNFSAQGPTGTDACSGRVGNNTPRCSNINRCFCLTYNDSDGINYTLSNFYDLVLPAPAPSSNSTYNNYALTASAVVASEDQEAKDEMTSSSTDSTISTTSYDNEDIAACKIASNIVQASTGMGDDMPAYLKNSNVANPFQIVTNQGSDTDVFGASSGDFKIDFATTNMMLSINMVIDSLTGMKLFSNPITTLDAYKSNSNSGTICDNCDSISRAITDDAANCAASGFLNGLKTKNLLKATSNTTDQSTAGLFGMVWLENNKTGVFADPLSNLANLGITMISSAVFYYTATMTQLFDAILSVSLTYVTIVSAAKLLLAASSALVPSGEVAFVGISALIEGMFQMLFTLDKFALELFLPLGSAVASILFVQGVVLGIFLPFLATITYMFGVIGWLFAVIEAMVASPLVAMGLTHPEGHDLLGQTEQALMLLLGVFIRPITMIIGMFFAISVAQAIMTLVNTGFLYVVHDFFNNMNSGAAGSGVGSTYNKVVMISTIGLLLVYTYICYSILEMCYGLISQIPDRILRWIGGPEQQNQAAQMAGKIKQDVSGAASKGSEGAGAATRAPQVEGPETNVSVAGAKRQANQGGDIKESGREGGA